MRTSQSLLALAWLAGGMFGTAPASAQAPVPSPAQTPGPVQSFDAVCASDKPNLADWRISAGLAREAWDSRVSCPRSGERADALRIEVRPGDAYDPNPGDLPSERVEIQARRELVRFDQTTWYRFRFRLPAPWPTRVNRTVIHQVKQNIEARLEIAQGGHCPAANPFFKIEAGWRDEVGGPAFVVKTRGTDNCRDGQSGVPVCGPWALQPGQWHLVQVRMRPSLREGDSDLQVWLDGRACPRQTGRLGYADAGRRDKDGRPMIDAQPRFGIYRDALPGTVQAIEFADLTFWQADPGPAWLAPVAGR